MINKIGSIPISRYVVGEMEDRSASRGIAPLLAYDIVLRIIPDASEEFHQHVLEAVAKVDPANAHVTIVFKRLLYSSYLIGFILH